MNEKIDFMGHAVDQVRSVAMTHYLCGAQFCPVIYGSLSPVRIFYTQHGD